MRTIIVILLFLYIGKCKAQSDSFIITIQEELRKIAELRLGKNKYTDLSFILDSKSNELSIYFDNSVLKNDSSQIKKILNPIKDFLNLNRYYRLSFLNDSLSNKTIATNDINTKNDQGNYYDFYANYPGGINAFRKIIIDQLTENLNEKDFKKFDLNFKLNFSVSDKGVLKFKSNNDAVKLIDLEKLKNWQPAFFEAKPISHFFITEKSLIDDFNDNKKFDFEIIENYNIYKYLTDSDPILFQSLYKPKEEDCELLVSFVHGDKLIEPHITKGDIKKANELIKFILSSESEKPLFSKNFYLKRLYFFTPK